MNNQSLMIGIVADNKDPEKMGRILVTFPSMPDGRMVWSRIVTPMAGEGKGQYFLPEIDDEVLVAINQGDFSSAYVLGSLWGTQRKPPEEMYQDENNFKVIRTRGGNTITFDDADGNERIEIKDKDENTILISTGDKLIKIESKGNIELYAESDIILQGKNIKMKADDSMEAKAGSSLSMDGGGTAELKAGTVNIN